MGVMRVKAKIKAWIEVISLTKVLAVGETGHCIEPFNLLVIAT
jgi:hypothetical protein